VDLAEYFGQTTHYFSESSGQLVALEEMPFNRAFYSHMKLLREFGDDYSGTPLSNAFVQILNPGAPEIREQLQKYGKACHMFIHADNRVRTKLWSAAKTVGKKVSTHRHEVEGGYGWIEATVNTEVKVTVKSHRGK